MWNTGHNLSVSFGDISTWMVQHKNLWNVPTYHAPNKYLLMGKIGHPADKLHISEKLGNDLGALTAC